MTFEEFKTEMRVKDRAGNYESSEVERTWNAAWNARGEADAEIIDNALHTFEDWDEAAIAIRALDESAKQHDQGE